MTIKEKVKMLANEKGMSIPNLELELGFGNGSISRWHTCSPSLNKVQAVAEYFHVPLDYFVERDDEPEESNDLNTIIKTIQTKAKNCTYKGVELPNYEVEFVKSTLNVIMEQLDTFVLCNEERMFSNAQITTDTD